MAGQARGWKARLVAPGAFVARNALRLVGATARHVVVHRERLDAIAAASQPVVVSFWHDQTFSGGWFLYREMHRRGQSLTLLASHSRDGDLLVNVARPWGLRVVRGSASRGGREAILGLYRELVDHGSSPLVVPDGPRGPAHECKMGALLLSKMAKVPILPIAFSPSRAWHIGSWDRMSVPKPFSRIGVAVGEPLQIARDASTPRLEEQCRELAGTLNQLANEARGVALAS